MCHSYKCFSPKNFILRQSEGSALSINFTETSLKKPLWLGIEKCRNKHFCMHGSDHWDFLSLLLYLIHWFQKISMVYPTYSFKHFLQVTSKTSIVTFKLMIYLICLVDSWILRLHEALSSPKPQTINYPEKISYIFSKKNSYILGQMLTKRKISDAPYTQGWMLTKCKIKKVYVFLRKKTSRSTRRVAKGKIKKMLYPGMTAD